MSVRTHTAFNPLGTQSNIPFHGKRIDWPFRSSGPVVAQLWHVAFAGSRSSWLETFLGFLGQASHVVSPQHWQLGLLVPPHRKS